MHLELLPAQHWVSLPRSLPRSLPAPTSELRPRLKPGKLRLLHHVYGCGGLLCFHPGGGGTVNHGSLMIIQIVELLMKEKNPLFLSSMYLGVRLSRAADYLFYVTNHLCKRHDSVCL